MKQFSVLFFFILVSKAMAWGPEGHKIVAQIAEDNLTPKAKLAISRLLVNKSLASVSNWADKIKADPHWSHTKVWHYVSIEDQDNYETSNHNPDGDLIGAISGMIKSLKSSSTSFRDKTNALMFLVHFVGDLHQPLHVGRTDDHGGNSISIIFNNRTTNLHAMWDSGIINTQNMEYQEYSRTLQSLPLNTKTEEFDINQIMAEDMALRDQIYLFYPVAGNPVTLDEIYIKHNITTVNERLLLGGKRLASLFNSIFK